MSVPISVGQILEIILTQVYNNQVETKNVFHYTVGNLGSGTGSPATVENFIMGFNSDILPSIFAVEATIVKATQITGNVRDETDFHLINGVTMPVLTSFPNGARSGDSLPPYSCWTFKYLRGSTSLRHGFKRFPGVVEGDQQNGLVTGDSIISALTALGEDLEAHLPAFTISAGTPLSEISASSATPVVIQRFREFTPLDPIIVGNIVGVVYNRIGTQNSRKFGVGI